MPQKNSLGPFSLPSREDILNFIKTSQKRVGKRDIARAFAVKGKDRIALKAMLRKLESEGALERTNNKTFFEPGKLPKITVLQASHLDADGELIARPENWHESVPPPLIFLTARKSSQPAVGIGDRVLARLSSLDNGTYEAKTIKKLHGSRREVLGICERKDKGGFMLRPVNRRDRKAVHINQSDANGAKHGELVLVEVLDGRRSSPANGRVIKLIHDDSIMKAISLIAIHSHGIPHK